MPGARKERLRGGGEHKGPEETTGANAAKGRRLRNSSNNRKRKTSGFASLCGVMAGKPGQSTCAAHRRNRRAVGGGAGKGAYSEPEGGEGGKVFQAGEAADGDACAVLKKCQGL